MFLLKKDTSILAVSREEQLETIEKLIATTQWRKGYYLLLTLSVLIVTAGLIAENTPVVIGGMILAPLLSPLLLLSLSFVTGSVNGILHSFKVLALSIGLTLGISGLLTWSLERVTFAMHPIQAGITPNVYILIAFCSGIAAAFAWVKKDLAPSIAGVAIAVSLLPPLCIAGIGLALHTVDLSRESLVLFSANVSGILLAAMIVFLILGFHPAGKVQEKVLAKEKKEAAKASES